LSRNITASRSEAQLCCESGPQARVVTQRQENTCRQSSGCDRRCGDCSGDLGSRARPLQVLPDYWPRNHSTCIWAGDI